MAAFTREAKPPTTGWDLNGVLGVRGEWVFACFKNIRLEVKPPLCHPNSICFDGMASSMRAFMKVPLWQGGGFPVALIRA
jgi:hypothetical protein